jgi:hypothetical protein
MVLWVWSTGAMLVTGENRRTRRKTCPSDIISTANPTWTEMGWKKCLRRDRLTTNSLQNDTKLHRVTSPNFVDLNNLILIEEDSLCLKYTNKPNYTLYTIHYTLYTMHYTLYTTIHVLRLTQLYNILLLYYCWLLVSASTDHHQANIKKKT